MFKTKRFGMFVHWGLYAIEGWHEQMQWRYPIESKAYQSYIDRFNPQSYNPKEWVKIAKETGMDYICFTTKHHDGFCMWDSKYTGFKITNSPCGRDVLKELSEECHKAGIGLSLYYSVPDWHHPNYPNFGASHELAEPKEGDSPNEALYIEYVKNQVTELLTNYGKIQSFFWDIPPKTRDASINELIRKLQPGIFINNRGYDDGDFSTPEREVPDGNRFDSYTEACNSVGRQAWGYRRNEDYYSNLYLTSAIDRIMAMGGNYVLNVGPDENGVIPEVARESLLLVGDWYKRVREALFAEPYSCKWVSEKEFLSTKKDNTIYLHFSKGLDATGFFVKNIKALPTRASVLNDGTELEISMDKMPTLYEKGKKNDPVFHINKIPVNRICSEVIIIKLEFENAEDAIVYEIEDVQESRY